MPDAPSLVLGPMLRHADDTTATVWVETTRPGRVAVRAGEVSASARTFEVAGHSYALVVVEGLPPGSEAPYAVELDGTVVWPLPGDEHPPPVIRTLTGEDAPQDTLDIVFGSCRVDRPHTKPYTLAVDESPDGVGVDALVALARACRAGRRLPDLLMMLGDQVYADEGMSPTIRERQVERRGADSEPRGEVADFEEYTWLYHESWDDPEVRWLLSTVPTTMIFDDHDVRDDWNTSQTWREQMARTPWWPARISGAYMSYWVYQHVGNLAPGRLDRDELWQQARGDGDLTAALRDFAARADRDVNSANPSMFSYVRHLGRTRLVVVDTRSGRLLDDQRREMLSAYEWDFVDSQLTGDVDHLLVAASLPVVLEPAIHDLEAWDEALASSAAWGRRAAAYAERLRQAIDLEHWPAFEDSFRRLVARLGEVAAGRHGEPPASVVLLSGDVHHSYVAPLRFPPSLPVRAAVVQLTSSPLRNAFPRSARRMFRFAHTRAARRLGRTLRRSARLAPLGVSWEVTYGPTYGNGLGQLELRGRKATARFETAVLDEHDDSVLALRHVERLTT